MFIIKIVSLYTVDVTITYEVLFDILRREKDNNELQDLDESFYEEVEEYIDEKKRTVESGKNSVYTPSTDQEKQKIQLRNIKRTVQEIYNIRERKIMGLARSKARAKNGLIDTTRLLVVEQPLFDAAVDLLERHRKETLQDVMGDRTKPKKASGSTSSESDEDLQGVNILKDLPKFLGPDKKVYGPFQKDDEVELPVSVAKLLTQKGRAENV